MRLWICRVLGLIPKEEPRYGFAIKDGKRVEFEKPLTVWEAIARISEQG
jgi:hypothetical protein